MSVSLTPRANPRVATEVPLECPDDDKRPRKRHRASAACEECRSRKVKCDGNRPGKSSENTERQCRERGAAAS
ncbi:hypothetical protein BJX62DRAFT_218613 [Aspergillus germanicus]